MKIQEKKRRKNNKGITLIALVISIIVILILAGVTIATLIGQNGILSRAQDTRGTNAYTQAEEQVKLAYMAVKTEIMTQKVNDSSYDATKNAGKLAKLVKQDLSGMEWQVELDGTTVTEETNNATEGTNINIIYTNTAIRKDSISLGKPKYNGEAKYNIKLEEQDATLSEEVLPSEFQQVEYIESTGTQYIDTEVIGKSYINSKIVFAITKTQDQHILSATNNGNRCAFGITDINVYTFGVAGNFLNQGEVKLNTIYNVDILFDKVSILKSNDTQISRLNSNDFNTGINLYLFARNNSNKKIDKYTFVKLYSCELYNSLGKFKKVFIPCYSTTTVTDKNEKQCPKDTIGLYDTVEGKFYTNQGTGEFLKGEDV